MKEQQEEQEYTLPTLHPSKDILLKRIAELSRRATETTDPVEVHNLTLETERLKERAKNVGKLVCIRPVLKFDILEFQLGDGSVITKTRKHLHPKYFELVETESQYTSLEVVGVNAYPEVKQEVESYFQS